MVDHIYGKTNIISQNNRPNMFIKELKIYIDFLKKKIENTTVSATDREKKSLFNFVENLKEGINYYDNLFTELKGKFEDTKNNIFSELEASKKDLNLLYLKI